jgi:hypothetical protein
LARFGAQYHDFGLSNFWLALPSQEDRGRDKGGPTSQSASQATARRDSPVIPLPHSVCSFVGTTFLIHVLVPAMQVFETLGWEYFISILF